VPSWTAIPIPIPTPTPTATPTPTNDPRLRARGWATLVLMPSAGAERGDALSFFRFPQ